MEPTVVDDSMDVASDVGHRNPGNIDDIEIDLDLAQERNPEQDDDVLVDDASATASDHPTTDANITYDADMEDGEFMDGDILASEYDQYQQGYYQLDEDSAYNNPMDYEAEIEDDYEEDIDAPIPDSDFEETDIPITKEVIEERKAEGGEEGKDEGRETEEVKVAENAKSPTPETVSKLDHVETEISNAPAVAEQHLVAREGTTIAQPKYPGEFTVEESNGASLGVENADAAHLSGDLGKYGEDVEPGLEDPHEHGQTEPESQNTTAQESEHQETESAGQKRSPLDQENQSDTTESYHFVEVQDYETQGEVHEIQKDSSLHPVKVLYQDSEISLFPPGENDPTETFFLQDEGLANAPVAELVGACRQVLGEHISEDEELILDIESLGLHLPENSTPIITTSLVQIVQVYLDLCSNDGINEPEPLYLTLSSRATFTAEFARLAAAANEGKGLSYLTWEDYDIDKTEEGVEHKVEDEEVHEQPLLTTENSDSPAEPDSHLVEPADEEEISSESATRSPRHVSTSQSPAIESPEQDLPVQAEPGFSAPTDEDDQVVHGNFPTKAPSHGSIESSQNAEECNDIQHGQGGDGGKEKVRVHEKDYVRSEHGEVATEPQDAASQSHILPQTMKIPTVDLSRDESTDQQSEEYVQGYEFNNAPHQLEAEAEDDIEEEYQDGGADVKHEEDHTESHTVSLDNGYGSDTYAQSTTNKDMHIEIDLGTNNAMPREEAIADHDNGKLDEGEIFEPGEGVRETENKENAVPMSNGEAANPALVIKCPTRDAPKTPELTHDFFEIDEDLFKSPVVEAHEAIAAIGSPTAPLHEALQEPLYCTEGAEPYPVEGPTSELVEVNATDGPTVDGNFHESPTPTTSDKAVLETDEFPARASPKSTKRSFIDSGINDVEGSTPDTKRHRPE
ncbi:hypothetical protein ACJ73_05504 [Blastomyces percursus]|uniref:Uncharacterized protein n=1 Tax=Blastomyces percursus TaxID=1658174 RepID=A0A1J9R3R1_9EURO|nr:hypothetical protein ACJ73_05504 [Blastomyces percursus]